MIIAFVLAAALPACAGGVRLTHDDGGSGGPGAGGNGGSTGVITGAGGQAGGGGTAGGAAGAAGGGPGGTGGDTDAGAVDAGADRGATGGGGAGGTGGAPVIDAGGSAGQDGGAAGRDGGTIIEAGPCTPALLIDDLENGMGFYSRNCRVGSWFTYNDGTVGATQTPAPMSPFTPTALTPLRGTSAYAAHTVGSGFTVWGAGMGISLNNPTPTMRLTYDASAYSGVTFWAMGTGTLRVMFPTPATDAAGGTCGTTCNDHWGEEIVLTAAWKQYEVKWHDPTFAQIGWGKPAVFDFSKIYAVNFQVAGSPTAPAMVNVWIDDISFLP